MVETNGYVGQLYRMLNDGDANVVTNAIVVLNEILIAKGGIELTQSIVMNLLNRIGEFSEWGLNTILDLVARYNPISEDETFAIMNLLDPVLRTANSGAVLATFKCFMKLTSSFPELQPQIYARAKPPMLTLITGSNFEVQFTMLKHLEVLLTRSAAAGIFDSEFRHFFVRYNEPSHVKYLKIELLPLISNDANAKEIAVELGEYVTDVDSELSKRSINAIGKIAMRVASVSPELTQTLLDLVDLDIHYVRAQAVKILSSVIRVFPAVRVHMLPVISKCLRRVEDYEAKATLIWMLGEYGQEIVEAPYLLESIIDNYDDEQSDLIKLHVLTAGMKLFFKRPPEMRAMLGRLFVSAVNDTLSQDVHDRALLYYRLLTADLLVAGSLFNSHSDTIRVEGGQFAEDKDDKTKSKIYCEFNTLAIIFGTPSDQFIAPPYQLVCEVFGTVLLSFPFQKVENLPIIDAAFEPRVQVEVSKDTPILQVHQSSGPVASGVDLLLDFGDTAIAAPVIQKSPFVLVEISPQQFQQLWMSLPESWSGQVCMLRSLPSAASEIEASFRAHNIKTVASGPLQGRESGFKFFLCTFEQDDLLTGTKGSPLLIQLSINTSNNTVNGVLKTAGASSHALISHISYSLRNWS